MKKLDTLTMEESRMVIAETLKVTNRVDDTVNRVDDKVNKVDDKMDKVDSKVDNVDDMVNRVDNKVDKVDDKVDKVDDKVDKVDDKVDKVDDKVDKVDNNVMVLIDGGESFSVIYAFLTSDMTANERSANTELRENLQKWLSPPDPSTNHNIARKAHHKGTASWFFQGSIFKQWKSSPLLWIHGKRTFLYPFITPHPIHSHICSGFRQKRPVVCRSLLLLSSFTHIYCPALG
jgi:archaellum component FlaC